MKRMVFEVIDINGWKRREYFEHYFTNIPCTYSMTVKLDITQIKRQLTRAHTLAGAAGTPPAALSSLTCASKPASSALQATPQPCRQVLRSFSRRINGGW